MVGCGVVLIAAIAFGTQSLLDSSAGAAQPDRPASPATATPDGASIFFAVPSTAPPTGFQLPLNGAAPTPGMTAPTMPQAQLTAAVLLDLPARPLGTPETTIPPVSAITPTASTSPVPVTTPPAGTTTRTQTAPAFPLLPALPLFPAP